MEFGLYQANENSKTKIYNFTGLNRMRKGSRYEFSDMYNMSADEYPCAAPCRSRKEIAQAGEINAVCAPDTTNTTEVSGITGVCDGGFYYNGELKSGNITLSPQWSWQIEQKGNLYIVNGYDKDNKKSLIYYYNIDTDGFSEGGKVMRNMIVTCGVQDESSGKYFLRAIHTRKYGVSTYSVTTDDGRVVNNADFCDKYMSEYYDNYGYCLNPDENIFEKIFKVGDDITIEGFPDAGVDGILWNIQDNKIMPQSMGAIRNNTVDTDNMPTTDSLSETTICLTKITGFRIIKIDGLPAHIMYLQVFNKNGEVTTMKDLASNSYGSVYCSGVTIKKRTRVLDNITVHHGRIWGSAPSGNQIYASASDDIFSFSSDDIANRYAARIPSDTPGTFTALCSYNNDLIAFKSDSITVISGSNPTNYSAYVIDGIGCIAPKSIAVTPEGVIFLSYKGFYIYNGSLPQCISAKLNKSYVSAVSGYDGESYYACAMLTDGDCEFLLYNLNYGLWHKRDDFNGLGFFRFLDGFYGADSKSLYKMDDDICGDWSFTLMRTHENSLDSKGINEIWIRAEISDNAMFLVETAVGNGEFERHSVFAECGLNVYRCPVRLRNGESYQIRISGSGKVVIYELEIKKTDGGRRYKEY